MENPDMLAFTYRIQRIVRDMKHADVRDEKEAARRQAAIEALRAVCEHIQRDFS